MKKFKTLCQLTQKGSGEKNEDTLGVCGNTAWVIDGATEVFPEHYLSKDNDVYRLMRLLDKYLPIAAGKAGTLQEMIEEALALSKEELEAEGRSFDSVPSYALPNFTVAACRLMEDRLQYYILGDCTIALLQEDGVHVMEDTRIRRFSESNRKKRLQNPGRENQIYQETRKKVNQPDGYFAGTMDGKGLKEGLTGEVGVSSGDRILLFTDGLLEAFSLFRIAKLDAAVFTPEKLSGVVKRLRAAQQNDPSRETVNRVRKSDDLSYLLEEVADET